MSGGIAYVLDEDGGFAGRCNMELVGFDPLEDDDVETIRALVEEHLERTGSPVAARVLDDWDELLPRFVKVMPHDYKRALAELAAAGNGHVCTTTTIRSRPPARASSPRRPKKPEPAAALMGELGAFLKLERVENPERDPAERVARLPRVRRHAARSPGCSEQGARCMECGVPFCHNGCPVNNLIPDWNDLVYRDRWREAIEQLHRTNNFPDFTGRLCPAPCEAACVLEIREGKAVTIKQIELAIVNRGVGRGLDRAAAADDAHRPDGRRDRRRARRASRARSSSPAPATR